MSNAAIVIRRPFGTQLSRRRGRGAVAWRQHGRPRRGGGALARQGDTHGRGTALPAGHVALPRRVEAPPLPPAVIVPVSAARSGARSGNVFCPVAGAQAVSVLAKTRPAKAISAGTDSRCGSQESTGPRRNMYSVPPTGALPDDVGVAPETKLTEHAVNTRLAATTTTELHPLARMW